jgi:dihydrofolate reductase
MNINIIVGCCKNYGIGKNNDLPWYFKSDLKHFANLTKNTNNNALIMGKNTWESLPIKPLPKRHNLILSSSLDISDNYNGYISKSFNNENNLFDYIEKNKYENIWVIGGEKIYKLFLEKNIVNNIYLTYIDKDYDCDVFFPNLEKYENFELKEIIKEENYDDVKLVYKLYKNINLNK